MFSFPIAPFIVASVFVSFTHDMQTTGAATQPEEITIAGCVQAGSNEGEWLLTADDKQAYHIQAAEELSVATHLNHRVELTGIVEKSDAASVLKVRALKMLADSCDVN